MMRMEDFMRMQQPPEPETPEKKEHHRRLEFRVDRYKITMVGDPPAVHDITQAHGKASVLRIEEQGFTLAHFPEDLEKANLIDEWAEHAWEERGHASFYPWTQVAKVEHWWWIDEDAAKVVDVDRLKPSPYL